MDRDSLLPLKEVAPRIGTTEAGLRWMLHNGTAPVSVKVGGRRLFRQSDIDRFIADAS